MSTISPSFTKKLLVLVFKVVLINFVKKGINIGRNICDFNKRYSQIFEKTHKIIIEIFVELIKYSRSD